MMHNSKSRPSFVRLFVAGFALGAAGLAVTQAQADQIIPAAVAQVAPR